MGTDTRKISRQLIGASSPPSTRPMKVPLKAAAWLTPRAMPRWVSGKTSVRMAEELAMSMAAPTPWKMRMVINQIAGRVTGHPRDAEQQGEQGEDGEAEVVGAHPAVDVAHAAEADHQHAGDDQEAQDHPEQVERVARLEWIEPDPPKDVGQGDEDDGSVDGGHQHPERRDEQGDPLVVRGQVGGPSRWAAPNGGRSGALSVHSGSAGPVRHTQRHAHGNAPVDPCHSGGYLRRQSILT